jgi:hypothetical protein
MGCDMVQGHQIAAAMPVEALIHFVANRGGNVEAEPDFAARLLAFGGRAG